MQTKTIVPVQNQRILILDQNYDKVINFEKCFPPSDFIVFKQEELENILVSSIVDNNYDPETTLFVFVGQSSLNILERINNRSDVLLKYDISFASAQRVYEEVKLPDGKISYNIYATVGQIIRKVKAKNSLNNSTYLELRIKNVVVVDDVVSTGITIKNLYDRNSFRFPNASWTILSLISRQEKITNFKKLFTPCLVLNKFTPINTFSTLVEDDKVRDAYICKHIDESVKSETIQMLNQFKEEALHSSRIYCFDLFNTLVVEKNMNNNNYLDYFIQNYGKKYSLNKENVYSYVRDNLMKKPLDGFNEMTKSLYDYFVPEEKCDTKEVGSIPYLISEYWRLNSENTKLIDKSVVEKLLKLKHLGHKLVLVTNCTYPAWKIISKNDTLDFEKYFNEIFVSSIEGFSKPEKKVWLKIESLFSQYPGSKFVMIGDNKIDDLDVPEKMGWSIITADKLCFDSGDKIFNL